MKQRPVCYWFAVTDEPWDFGCNQPKAAVAVGTAALQRSRSLGAVDRATGHHCLPVIQVAAGSRYGGLVVSGSYCGYSPPEPVFTRRWVDWPSACPRTASTICPIASPGLYCSPAHP